MSFLYTEENHLAYKIESIRNEMIQTGIREGLSSKKTVELSQLLDYYVFQYQQQAYKTS